MDLYLYFLTLVGFCCAVATRERINMCKLIANKCIDPI